jgi:hypothetical protein
MTPDAQGTNQQVTVGPPADSVALPNRLITQGKSSSRADGVARAIQREQRRRAAERDAELYRAYPEVVGTEQEEWDRARQFPNLEG